jgi:hypothetical protein
MKNLIFIVLVLLLETTVIAQSPQSFRYQAVARDNSGNVLSNQSVSFRISILSGSVSGTEAYIETHTGLTTNAFGLVELEIGKGTPVKGTFSSINWVSNNYFVKIEMDPDGGTTYQTLSTSQLLSVPYALYSQKAGNGFSGDYNDLTNRPLLFDGTWNSLTGKPAGTASGEMLYWNGATWVNVAPGTSGQVLTFINGVPTWQKPAIPTLGSTDVYNHATGKIWMDRNLGATQVAISTNDAAAYGDLYQWGRQTDGHQLRISETTSILALNTITPSHDYFILSPEQPFDWHSPQSDFLWKGVSGFNNPCPTGYRLPTEAEWDAERMSWSSNNATGAFASPLKLPLAGTRDFSNGFISMAGSYGYYWSSSVSSTYSRYLNFGFSTASMITYGRAEGASVRCLKD